MKKIKLLLLISVSAMIFTSCGDKYSIGNLKKNDKLLKETAIKCKQKKDEKICRNVEQAQNELAQEWWKKVKPEVSKKVDKISKDLVAGNYKASFDEMPEKFLAYLAKKASVSTNELKNVTIKKMNQMTSNMKIIENTYDFENVKVGKTETGRNYAIIPTKVTIIYNGQKINGEGKTMAFEDGNKWYIINYEKEYMIFLKDVYPDLAKMK